MDFEQKWETALKVTEIIRSRIQPLAASGATFLPYVFLCEMLADSRTTMVRKGKIEVGQPSLFLPPNTPQFEGFEMNAGLKSDVDSFMSFLLVRGVRFPSLKYNNIADDISVFDDRLSGAVKYHQDLLAREENLTTGLIVGRESCWQFSILIFAASQILKSADGDIRRLMDEYRRKQ